MFVEFDEGVWVNTSHITKVTVKQYGAKYIVTTNLVDATRYSVQLASKAEAYSLLEALIGTAL